ncbi:MAG: RluA family pseudouridine synthase [Oscillospiraceae bacterium]|nr:RluA family pseudouridine synthase [Oscillospiraceae bacterium]MBR0451833.1 RluA family pseudouridine synthase [Oscillospiraceae bacterium]
MENRSELLQIAIDNDYSGRLDKYIQTRLLTLFPDEEERFSRSYVQKLFADGNILIDGKPVSKNEKVKAGAIICIDLPAPQALEAEPQNIPIDIVYEDDDIIVVNKPKGMVVHPGAGNPDGTLVNALLYHCSGRLSSINGVERPGIVHRIDKDTSGLLVVAKNDFAHFKLAEQICAHTVTRYYYAVAYGHLKDNEGVIDAPIGRKANDRIKFCVTDKNSKEAVTEYRVLEEMEGYTYLELHLRTGRTHQIRVHMEYIGHPLVGDKLYGNHKQVKYFEGQCLHAGVLGFIHPRTGEYMEFKAELPEYFVEFLNSIRS